MPRLAFYQVRYLLEAYARHGAFSFRHLLAEFHVRWPSVQRQYPRMLAALRARGLRIVHERRDELTHVLAFVNEAVGADSNRAISM